MGREQAAIALAFVSAKPAEQFTAPRCNYFYGMVARAKAGTHNLSAAVWALRSNAASKKNAPPRLELGPGD